ncbi:MULTISPECIES: histidine phosphatase family protein [Emticicia]|uniref:histidine phosphatase family protein n=1 Tax=Emticicia TaxID=312278 RepID=UPI0007D8B823|nr:MULTISPECIES: histidine phosphatase family protein [Emticicia]
MKKFIILALILSSCKSTFYIARHAEKVDNSANPPLSTLGKERAEDLKQALLNKQITDIYSTNFLRTQNTSKPLADALGKQIKVYAASPADSMRVFIERLKTMKGKKVLIVGHSNTCKYVVNGLLEKDTLRSDIPDNDFDNLYIIERNFFPVRKMRFFAKTYGKTSPQ